MVLNLNIAGPTLFSDQAKKIIKEPCIRNFGITQKFGLSPQTIWMAEIVCGVGPTVVLSWMRSMFRKKWSADLESVQGEMWIQCLHYLWAVSQPQFSTKFVKVDSNDVYYGSSEKYRWVGPSVR